jgi:putative Mn2+ efflux pump MntP
MTIFELVVLAIGLAMDAFAVAICKGLSSRDKFVKTGIACGIWFGFFQALMPLIGWALSQLVTEYVETFAPFIAFGLLIFLGIKMIKEAVESIKDERLGVCSEGCDSSLAPKVMFVFAIATSIDALAAGVSISMVDANIWLAILFIGLITFAFSFIGSIIGAKLGSKFKSKAELAGGVILIALGIKILVEGIINLV